ncbi:hypothetical protein Scep_017235 [Stephania cephalantha]|uniref:Uncharacterized protein n=1 Tax=Stephania cephalantha TaxID=152367 RepID=A0AAP0IP89_9MAGN
MRDFNEIATTRWMDLGVGCRVRKSRREREVLRFAISRERASVRSLGCEIDIPNTREMQDHLEWGEQMRGLKERERENVEDDDGLKIVGADPSSSRWSKEKIDAYL